MSKNRYKSDSSAEAKETPVSRKKLANPFSKIKWPQWLSNERLHKGIGLLFLLFAAYSLIAFTSYLFTGKADQSIINTTIEEIEQQHEVRNWLGKYGAELSQFFIGELFGVASFVFVMLSFLIGFRILFHVNLMKPKVVLKYVLFTLVWLPAALGFLFDIPPYDFLGGGIGSSIDYSLGILLGDIGLALTLFFILAGFVIVNFNLNLASLVPSTEQNEEKDNQGAAHNAPDNLAMNQKEEEPTLNASDASPAESDESPEEIDLSTQAEPTDDPKEKSNPVGDETSVELDAENKEEKPENTQEDTNPEDDVAFEIEEKEEEEELSSDELNKKVTSFGEYDPTLDLPRFEFPPVNKLADHGGGKIQVDREELEANKNRIVDTLKNYKIEIAQIKATIGPTVTLYEIIPEAGVRISKIKNLEDDIALSLSALGIRIIAPIPGKGTIGIEVPNQKPDIVSMRTMIASDKFQNTDMALPIALGKTISNENFVADLAKMPHLLMAGATGQGKSVGLNVILTSLLYKKHPSQVKFVLVDPKKVELTLFNKIERHYLAKLPDSEEAIITDTKKVVATLNSLCIEMDDRYELLKNAMVRNITEYNHKFINRKLNPENGHRYLPYIVLVIDEFADLIMTAGKEVETPIARLAQLARAIGIHLIIATQRPSVNIITGIIKANFPSRIAFRVTSKIDSRTILDSGGADQLIGRGDMLLSQGSDLIRIQCAFVDTPEVEEITDFIGNQQAYPDAFLLPEYVGEEGSGDLGGIDASDRDALFKDAARIVVQHQQGSASLLQRRLKLGYNRAGRIVDQLEAAGIIGPFEGSKARQVLIPDEAALEQLLNNESA